MTTNGAGPPSLKLTHLWPIADQLEHLAAATVQTYDNHSIALTLAYGHHHGLLTDRQQAIAARVIKRLIDGLNEGTLHPSWHNTARQVINILEN